MSRRESTLRNSVCHNLAALHAVAVENPVLPGTPDVNVLDAWIELKSLDKWPERAPTIVRCDHWTPEQRVFHLRRSAAGGRVYLLVEVCASHEYLLLEGAVAVRIFGRSDRAALTAAAIRRWLGKSAAMEGLLAFFSPKNVPRPTPDPDAGLLAGP